MSLFSRRPRMIAVAAVTGVAALALAGWGLAPRTDADGRSLGPRMAIRLVAPKEPEIAEGGVLEVGVLNDGFDRAALERAAVVDDPTWTPPEAYAGGDDGFLALPRMPPPRPVADEDLPAPPAPPEPRSPLRDGSRWFGLDRFRADAAAERAERRERRAAQEAFERREYADRREDYGRAPWDDGPDVRDRYDDRDGRDRRDRDWRDRAYGDGPPQDSEYGPDEGGPEDYPSE